jgi:hypothetical protein
VLVFPYLAWVRSVRGHWALSVRPSVGSAAAAVGTLLDGTPTGAVPWSTKLVEFLKAIYRLTYLVTIPAYLLGFVALFRKKAVPVLFLLSFPLGYFGGLLFSLRVHTFMSYRYVIPPMAVLMAVAALGFTDGLRRLAAARPGSPRLATAAAGVLLLLGVLPGLRALSPTRWECRSYSDAARWIESKGRPRAVSGPLQQVAYLTGCRSYYSAETPEGIATQVARDHVDYYVYSERDVQKRPDYVALLRSSPALEGPVEITGPPGTLKVYIHRVR